MSIDAEGIKNRILGEGRVMEEELKVLLYRCYMLAFEAGCSSGSVYSAEDSWEHNKYFFEDDIKRLYEEDAEPDDDYIEKTETDGCNCQEMAMGQLAEYPHVIIKEWWVCPKHGYTKR